MRYTNKHRTAPEPPSPTVVDFGNATGMSDGRLLALFAEGFRGWSVGRVAVRVRHGHGADFSGSCRSLLTIGDDGPRFANQRIFVNVGRHLRYPYRMATHVARRARPSQPYSIELGDAYQLATFVFMHELYHLLVARAGRDRRRKEAECDRFAARHLAGRFHAAVRREDGRRAPRAEWDFQDLERFVAAARDPGRGIIVLAPRQAASSGAGGRIIRGLRGEAGTGRRRA